MLLDRILGAQVNVVPGLPGETEAQTEARCHQLGLAHAARLEAEGHRCYDVPMGGASPVGSAAFVGGYLEMMEQCAQMGDRPDAACTRRRARAARSPDWSRAARRWASGRRSPAWPSAARTRATRGAAPELANASLAWLGSDTRVTAADFDVERGYFEPGYEQPNEAANEAIRLLARTEGLLTDPVYTGKALAGLIGHVRDGAGCAGRDGRLLAHGRRDGAVRRAGDSGRSGEEIKDSEYKINRPSSELHSGRRPILMCMTGLARLYFVGTTAPL